MIVLDTPLPIYHREGGCGGVALLTTVLLDKPDMFDSAHLRHVSGEPVRATDLPRCDACGGAVERFDFLQMWAEGRLKDELRASPEYRALAQAEMVTAYRRADEAG